LFVDVVGSEWRWEGKTLWRATPLFILHGGPGGCHLDFNWICPVSQSRALANHLPNAVLKVYANSAHQPQVDEPGRFRKDMAAFVRRFLPPAEVK